MKRFLCHTLGGAVLALGFSLSAPVLAQENIAYPGDPLQDINHLTGSMSDTLTTSVITVNGFHKSLSVTDNTVTLDSGAPNPAHVFGAVNYGDTDGLSGNRVVIKGGTMSAPVAGASHDLNDGNTSTTNNRVEINGGTVDVRVAGGAVDAHNTGDARANDNTVVIAGGANDGQFFGGHAYSGSGQAEASNNTVHIGSGLSATVFGPNAGLFGGYAYTSTGTTVSTGNTLKIESAGLNVQGLAYFQRFEFTLPAGLTNGNAVLTVTTAVDIDTDAVVTVDAAPGFNPNPGDAFTLIGCGANCTFSGTVAATSQSGTIAGYPYTVAVESNNVVLRILPRQIRATAAPIPVASGGVLAALGLLLAGLAAVRLRRC